MLCYMINMQQQMSTYALVFSCIHIWKFFLITYFLLNILGKPCQLYNNRNPDWVPTVNLGHDKVFQSPPPSALNPSRYARNINRSSKKKQSEAASALPKLQDTDNTNTISVERDVETAQTTIHWQHQHNICGTGRRNRSNYKTLTTPTQYLWNRT